MTILSLPIQIGRKYVRRDGKIATIIRRRNLDDRLLVTDIPYSDEDTSNAVVFENSGNALSAHQQADLVADYIKPATSQHPYAEILRAIADGKEVQWQCDSGYWINQGAASTLEEISNEELPADRYRIKPRTINMNGREVPEPVREAPKRDKHYFVPGVAEEHFYRETTWSDDRFDHLRLQRGIIHLTRDAAIAHAKAMLNID